MKRKPRTHGRNYLPDVSPEVAKVLQGLDPEKRREVLSVIAVERETFSGPIPHPDILRGYEDVQQGIAERIVSLAEQEQAHRLDMERQIVRGAFLQTRRGQWMGLTVAVLFLIVAAVLGWLGHDWLAGTLGGGTLVALVTIFVKNRSDDTPEQ